MCYMCDRDQLLNAYAFNAAYLTYKSHFGGATGQAVPDGVGDFVFPGYTELLIQVADTQGADTDSAGALTVGAPAIVSTINTVGDQDFYAVELVAGRTYDFALTAKLLGPGGVPLADSFLELYDANGGLLTSADGGADTALNSLNSGLDALLTFTAQTSALTTSTPARSTTRPPTGRPRATWSATTSCPRRT